MPDKAQEQPGFQVDPSRLIEKYQKQVSSLQQQLILVDTGFEQLQAEYQQLQELNQMLQTRLTQLEQEFSNASEASSEGTSPEGASISQANGKINQPKAHQARGLD